MKAMRRIAAKIAGVTLATVMAFGGATAFAAENGDEVYDVTVLLEGHGAAIIDYHLYEERTIHVSVPDDGMYAITITTDHPDSEVKYLSIVDPENRRIPLVEAGNWSSITQHIDLYAGVDYLLRIVYPDLGWKNNPTAEFNIAFRLEEKYEEESTSIVPYMEGHFAPGMPYAPGMPLGLELPRRGGYTDPAATTPSMPQIVIGDEPETDGPFDMYVGIPDSNDGTTIPSMPDIVIDAEPEAPVTFTMLISAEPEICEEPEEIIDVEEEPAEIVTIAEAEEATAETVESIAPVFTLTAEQMRTLAVRNFVGHLYTDGLGRRATESEITEWADKLMSGNITATEAASQILTSSELNDHNFDNEQIAAILDEVFGTDSESDTLAQLNGGASVASVIEQLAGTDNWASKCAFYGVNV